MPDPDLVALMNQLQALGTSGGTGESYVAGGAALKTLPDCTTG